MEWGGRHRDFTRSGKVASVKIVAGIQRRAVVMTTQKMKRQALPAYGSPDVANSA